jgi:hypothetical protein
VASAPHEQDDADPHYRVEAKAKPSVHMPGHLRFSRKAAVTRVEALAAGCRPLRWCELIGSSYRVCLEAAVSVWLVGIDPAAARLLERVAAVVLKSRPCVEA